MTAGVSRALRMASVRTPPVKLRVAAAFMTVCVLAAAAFASLDPDAAAGQEALRGGSLQEARARLEAAVKRAPSDYELVFRYVSALPHKDALRVTDSLSKAKAVPGWAKARALKLLGDQRFAKEDYKKAADFYKQASALDNSSTYKYLYAAAIAVDGQTAEAADILGAIAGNPTDTVSGEAANLLAQLRPDGTTPAPVPKTGDSVTAAAPVQPAPVQPSPSVNQQNIIFTIQVGAFGSRDNADNLVRKLSGAYKDITISQTETNGQTMYRVRVGAFSNREDAVAFADKLVKEDGMSARVVEQ